MSREERILAIVMAQGTLIEPSKINRGMVVVVNGLTGLDACERSAERCFDTLLDEEDGKGSPGRVEFGMTPQGLPTLKLSEPVSFPDSEKAP